MTGQLHCAGCGRRFGRRGRTVVMFETFCVCVSCSTSVVAHRKIFAGCGVPGCHARRHGGDLTTVGTARRTLTLTGHLEGN